MSRLGLLLAGCAQPPLPEETLGQFAVYLELILRWNARTNLTAVREPDEIESRHFLESIVAARALPAGVATLLDLGSGAGFPGLPIALCRQEIQVTLAESQGKKAAFLREVLRTLGVAGQVHGSRAEELQTRFDCVTLRAVDRMDVAVRAAVPLVRPAGWLAVMTTLSERTKVEALAGAGFCWEPEIALPGSEQRVLLLGKKQAE